MGRESLSICFSSVCLFIFIPFVTFYLFIFLLVPGVGCDSWLWHSLDFPFNVFAITSLGERELFVVLDRTLVWDVCSYVLCRRVFTACLESVFRTKILFYKCIGNMVVITPACLSMFVSSPSMLSGKACNLKNSVASTTWPPPLCLFLLLRMFWHKKYQWITRFDQIHQLFHKILSINIILKSIKGHNSVEKFGEIMCISHIIYINT